MVNQKVAMKILEKIGCNVDISKNGKEALDTLEVGKYDIVLMDCQMPEMDGYEATRRIRAMSEYDGLPVIAMTAGVTREEREMCTDAGMNDFISKPIGVKSVSTALKKWVVGES